MIVRPGRARDLVKHTKYMLPAHFIGVVAEDAGEVKGAGWIIFDDDGVGWVCFEGDRDVLARKTMIARASKRLVGAAQEVCDELRTLEQADWLNGSRWLSWLGFKPTGEVRDGMRVLEWQKRS